MNDQQTTKEHTPNSVTSKRRSRIVWLWKKDRFDNKKVLKNAFKELHVYKKIFYKLQV